MNIPPEYDVHITTEGIVVISHPTSDNTSDQFLRGNLDLSKVIKTFISTEGGRNYVSKETKDWLINNYFGLKKVVIDFSNMNNYKVLESVAERLD